MELIWNNPSPNRTADRPLEWEVISRNGTSTVIRADEIQAVRDRKVNRAVKEAVNDVQTVLSAYFCF